MEIIAATQFGLKLGLIGAGALLTYKLNQKRVKLATGKLDNKLKTGKDGIQLSKNFILSKDAGHTLILAPTQAGKSTSIYIPNLLQNNIRGSIIVYDPSQEIYNLTSNYQKSIGRKVILYEPLSPGRIEYNILEQCKTDREVMQLAQALLINGSLSIELPTGKKAGGAEWLQLAQNLLAACLLLAKHQGKGIKYALQVVTAFSDERLAMLFEESNPRSQELYASFMAGCDAIGMQASIKGTMQSNLNLFFDELAINKTYFTAEQLRKEETIIYIKYPEHMAYYLSPLMAPLYSQIINKLIDFKGIPVWFFFDEFSNIGQLTAFNINISSAAKRDIKFVLAAQDFNQLKQVYGHDNALTIWNNCKNKVVLPGISDTDTLRLLSTLCDEEEITIQQEKVKVRTKKLLFTSGEIRRLPTGKCLIISDNFQPVLDDTNYYKNNPEYLERCS